MGINFKCRNSHSRLKPLEALRLSSGLVVGVARLVRPMGLLLIMVCTFPVFSQEINQGGTAAALRELEHEWVEGQSHNDNRVLDLIFDNSLVYVEYGRLVTKSEYLLRIKDAHPQLSQIVMESYDCAHVRNHGHRNRNLSGARSPGRKAAGEALAVRGYLGVQRTRMGAGCGRSRSRDRKVKCVPRRDSSLRARHSCILRILFQILAYRVSAAA